MKTWSFGQPGAHLDMLMGGLVVDDEMDVEFGRGLAVDDRREGEKLLMPVTLAARADDLAGGHIEGREQRRGSVADIVVSVALDIAQSQRKRRLGPVKSLDLALLVDTGTTALSGGLRYRPTTSRTFSTKNGSLDSLKVLLRCGLPPNSENRRCTVLFETPWASAMRRTLQALAFSGLSCRADVISVATFSSS